MKGSYRRRSSWRGGRDWVTLSAAAAVQVSMKRVDDGGAEGTMEGAWCC